MKSFMKTVSHSLAILLLAAILCVIPSATSKAYSIESGQYIYDDADLLTENEISKLDTYLRQVAEKWNIDIFILTTNNDQGYSSSDYIINFEDQGHRQKGIFKDDSVIVLVNMDSHEVFIRGYGICERQISDSRIESILDVVTPSLSSSNYYNAMYSFIEQTDIYMDKNVFYFQLWFQLLVACAIGGIVVLIMSVSRGTPITTNSNTYLDQENSRLRFHHDNYVRTVVTKTKKPENNGGSHGSGGGGRSSSGGGRKF